MSNSIDEIASEIEADLNPSFGPGVDPKILNFSGEVNTEGVSIGVIEARSKDMSKEAYFDVPPGIQRPAPQIVYVRAGNWIFLDDRLKPEDGYDNSNIIYLPDFDSTLANRNLLVHSALAVSVQDTLDLTDKVILDLGCADGVLGLVAIRKGARKVYSLESESRWRYKYFGNIDANCMDLNNFNYIPGDLCTALELPIPLDSIDIVLANIGPEYGESDLAAIKLLKYMPRVTTFLGAGYQNKSGDPWKKEISSKTARERLESIGFEYKADFLAIDHSDPNSFFKRLAFVAERI